MCNIENCMANFLNKNPIYFNWSEDEINYVYLLKAVQWYGVATAASETNTIRKKMEWSTDKQKHSSKWTNRIRNITADIHRIKRNNNNKRYAVVVHTPHTIQPNMITQTQSARFNATKTGQSYLARRFVITRCIITIILLLLFSCFWCFYSVWE